MKRKWLIYFLIFDMVVGSIVIYIWFFVYNKPHRDIEKATPDFTITAEALLSDFDNSDTTANRKYNEKIIQFSGTFSTIEPADTTVSIVFDFGGKNIISAHVLPKYKNEVSALAPGTFITLKGLYKGYISGDEMFALPGNILLNKCSPVK